MTLGPSTIDKSHRLGHRVASQAPGAPCVLSLLPGIIYIAQAREKGILRSWVCERGVKAYLSLPFTMGQP